MRKRSTLRGLIDRIGLGIRYVDAVPCDFMLQAYSPEAIRGVISDGGDTWIPAILERDGIRQGPIDQLWSLLANQANGEISGDAMEATATAPPVRLSVSGRIWVSEGGGQLSLLVRRFDICDCGVTS